MRAPTWKYENAVVAAFFLAAWALWARFSPEEFIGFAGAFCAHSLASIADREVERATLRGAEHVECYRLAWWYGLGLQACAGVGFGARGVNFAATSALVTILFAVWRRVYRARIKPLAGAEGLR